MNVKYSKPASKKLLPKKKRNGKKKKRKKKFEEVRFTAPKVKLPKHLRKKGDPLDHALPGHYGANQ